MFCAAWLVMFLLLIAPDQTVRADILQPGPHFIVTSLDDPNPSQCLSNYCSLRDAILAATNQPGPNSITFAVQGTILLNNQLPTISDSLTITGSASGIILSGINQARVFEVSANGHLNLYNLTIANDLKNTLTTSDSVIYNQGILNIAQCTFAAYQAQSKYDEGSAIQNDGGSITITDTIYRDNFSGSN
jgi:CSLREA domain-containing protein